MRDVLLRALPEKISIIVLSFYICIVIDSFCFSQPKRHNLNSSSAWGEVPVYWRRGGSATFDLLLQNSPMTKQKSIGSFIVTLMNSPITKRCFVIPIRREESLIRDLLDSSSLLGGHAGTDPTFWMTLLLVCLLSPQSCNKLQSGSSWSQTRGALWTLIIIFNVNSI